MEAEAMKLVEWQRRYGTEAACAAALAERLRQLIGVSWVTASRMLRKLRTAMGARGTQYGLTELIEPDDALVGGRRSGKHRCRTGCSTSVSLTSLLKRPENS